MNKAPFVIPNEKARALILAKSGLAGVRQEGGAAAVAPLVRKLGYVQLDSIKIVERAHHHILYSRHTGYRPRHLDRMQARAPALFEHCKTFEPGAAGALPACLRPTPSSSPTTAPRPRRRKPSRPHAA